MRIFGDRTNAADRTADRTADRADYRDDRTAERGVDRNGDGIVDRSDDRLTDRAHGTHAAEVEQVHDTDYARDKFGGLNSGASFFGWLVALGVAVLLTGVVAVVATALGDANDVSQTDAERAAGTVGLTSGIVLIVVLLIGYYAGGYVAGRMSRFDGARQGFGVWMLGLLVTVIVVVVGWVAGDRYNVFDRVNLPRIPIPHDELSAGGVITGIIVLVGTLLAAMAGGKVGHHYHDRVDRLAERTVVRG